MKSVRLASLLPEFILKRLARRFDDEGAFELPELGSAFWMEASYWRWVRQDKRKKYLVVRYRYHGSRDELFLERWYLVARWRARWNFGEVQDRFPNGMIPDLVIEDEMGGLPPAR